MTAALLGAVLGWGLVGMCVVMLWYWTKTQWIRWP